MRVWTGGSDDWQCQKRQTDPAEWGLMIWNQLLQFAGLSWMATPETWLFSIQFVVLWKKQRDLVEDNLFECFVYEWKEIDRSVLFYMRSVGFLSSGVTWACLNAVGKMPVRRDVLIMCVSAGNNVGEIAWRRCVGSGSRGHVVGWLERRSLDTSASVRGQKEKMGVWAVDLVGWRSCVSEGENWLLIVLVLSVKQVAKSSAVIEVVGGGGGVQKPLTCMS